MNKWKLIDRLKKLESTPEIVKGWPSQEAAMRWAGEVAPLLRFNEQYHQEFRQRAARMGLRLSADGQIGNLNRMVAIIHEAIAHLEAGRVGPEPIAAQAETSLEWPQHVTLGWLRDHVPAGLWVSLGGAFVAVFLAGITFGRSDLYERLMITHDSAAKINKSPETVTAPKKSSVETKKSN